MQSTEVATPTADNRSAYDIDLYRLEHDGHAVQADFFVCDASYAAFIAGRGCGKTTVLLADGICYAEDWPGSIQVMTEPSFPMLKDVLLPALHRHYDGLRPKVLDWTESPPINVRFANGSEIWLRAADSVDEDMRRGPNLARTLMDEATLGDQEETFNVLHAANRDIRFPIRQTKVTGTPKGRNWVWRRFLGPDRMLRARLFLAETIDSERAGFVPAGYTEELAEQYGGWDNPRARQELAAQFLEMAGQVFAQFRRDAHVRTLPVPVVSRVQGVDGKPEGSALSMAGGPLKRVLGGIDPGGVSPTALVLAGLDAGGRLWAYREWYRHEATIDEVIKAMAEFRQREGIQRWVIDPAANKDYGQKLRNAGFEVTPARHRNSRELRVQLVGGRLNVGPDKLPGMYLTPEVPNLIAEIEGLQWRASRLPGGGEERYTDDFERGCPDHAFDALANVIAELDAIQQAPIRPSHGISVYGR